jgi:hypothetical protein
MNVHLNGGRNRVLGNVVSRCWRSHHAFLLTMWLLSSAGVQSRSLQFNKAAQFRTQAVYFATDLAERMQANRPGRRRQLRLAGETLSDHELHDGAGCPRPWPRSTSGMDHPRKAACRRHVS